MIELSSLPLSSGRTVQCTINRGEMVCFKVQNRDATMLLDLLEVSAIPAEGSVTIEGMDTRVLPSSLIQMYRRNIIVARNTKTNQTVREFLTAPFLFSSLSTKAIQKIVENMITSFDVHHQKEATLDSLTSYDRIRLTMAIIEQTSPRILFFDDLLSDLTLGERRAITQKIEEFSSSGMTVIFFLRDPKILPLSYRVIDAVNEQSLLPASEVLIPRISTATEQTRVPIDSEQKEEKQIFVEVHEEKISVSLEQEEDDYSLARILVQRETETLIQTECSRLPHRKVEEECEVPITIKKEIVRDIELEVKKKKRSNRSFEPGRYVPKNKKLATPVKKEEIDREAKSLPVFSKKG
jgi:ABC-type ATPase involved in cell division